MKALIIVDLQNDFLPGGALAVPQGDEVIPVINRLLKKPFDIIVATQDWHPRNHGSFAENHGRRPGEVIMLEGIKQVLWPAHCVQGSLGAEITPQLQLPENVKHIFKGTHPTIDSYSTFHDNGHRRSTGLGKFLKEACIDEVYLAGLALDYCVKFSALDSIHEGFITFVIEDACRGINLNPGDCRKTLEEIRSQGGFIVQENEI